MTMTLTYSSILHENISNVTFLKYDNKYFIDVNKVKDKFKVAAI